MKFHEAYEKMEAGQVARYDGAIYRLFISKWANGNAPEWSLYEHISIDGYWSPVEELSVEQVLSKDWEVFDLEYIFGDDIPQERREY